MIDRDHLRRMSLAAKALYPLADIARRLERTPRHHTARLFDEYAATADWIRHRPGGLTPSRRRWYELLMDFAWFTNDRMAQIRARELVNRRMLPAYARDILTARMSGEVPAPVDGIHVAVGFRFNARRATRAAFIVVPWRAPYQEFSFVALAGLHVEILATAVDLPEVDHLALELELQGARRVQFRRIDGDFPPVLLYDGGHSFVYRRLSSGVYG